MTGHSRPVIGFSMWVAAAETVIKNFGYDAQSKAWNSFQAK